MREFFIVLKFEFLNFVKNKAFIISTAILLAMIVLGLSFPTIKDTFFSDGSQEGQSIEEELGRFAYIDRSGGKVDMELLKESFPAGKLKEFTSREEVEKEVEEGKIEAGFIIEDSLKYKNIIKNNEMMSFSQGIFEEALIQTYRIKELQARGIEYSQLGDLIEPQVDVDTVILGKDSANNFLYTYILVFGLYFIILMYGQLIASGVASEKSNRAMEVLVTSTDSKNLIFGKVTFFLLTGSDILKKILGL